VGRAGAPIAFVGPPAFFFARKAGQEARPTSELRIVSDQTTGTDVESETAPCL
jgi:hypothetical protein